MMSCWGRGCQKRGDSTDRLWDWDSERGVQKCGKFALRHLWMVPYPTPLFRFALSFLPRISRESERWGFAAVCVLWTLASRRKKSRKMQRNAHRNSWIITHQQKSLSGSVFKPCMMCDSRYSLLIRIRDGLNRPRPLNVTSTRWHRKSVAMEWKDGQTDRHKEVLFIWAALRNAALKVCKEFATT